ncbi:V-type proton ATPase subunit C, partial [Sarracenia purpurea var. burkii]
MATRYWVVSLPVQSSPSPLWSRLQESISKHAFDTPLYRFNIPNLRVGTLDSLLAISDDLFKSNSFIEGVSQKIRRQIEDLERISGVISSSLTVDGVPVDSYLTRFMWDEAKYPTMSSLKEIVDGIHGQIAKIEDDLKATSRGVFKTSLLSAMLVKKGLKKGDVTYLMVHACEKDVPEETLSKEIKGVLDKYKDVIPHELYKKLLTRKEVCHIIDLEQSNIASQSPLQDGITQTRGVEEKGTPLLTLCKKGDDDHHPLLVHME